MFVKPGPHPHESGEVLKVRMSPHRFLSEEGEEVPDTLFWRRRLRDGDVVLTDPAVKIGELIPDGVVRTAEFTGTGPAAEPAIETGIAP